MRVFLLSLWLVSSVVFAHDKPKPKPEPVVQEKKDSNYRGVAIAIVGIGGLVYWAWYLDEQKNKKVTIAPMDDGKGATASMEWRF